MRRFLEWPSSGQSFPSTPHDLLVQDLVYTLNMRGGHVGRLIAVPEVIIEGARLDAVALDLQRSEAFAFEVKVRASDARAWLKAERWKDSVTAGAKPVLAYPEDLDIGIDVPDEVDELRKFNDGTWGGISNGIRLGFGYKPTTELLIGFLSSLKRQAFWSGHIEDLGVALSSALIEGDDAADEELEAAL